MKKFLLLLLFAIVYLNGCSSTDAPTDASLRIRKSASSLTAQEKQNFVNAVLQLKRTPSPYDSRLNYYDQFVKWHLEAFRCMNGGHSEFPAHMAPGFLPWHRQFLLMFEEALRNVSGKNITIPYWDWLDPQAQSIIFSDSFLSPAGDSTQDYAVVSGPFRKENWKLEIFDDMDIDSLFAPVNNNPDDTPFLVRAMGKMPAGYSMPTQAEMQFLMDIPTYDVAPYDATADTTKSFRNYLEGWRGVIGMQCNNGSMDVIPGPTRRSALHNVVHLYVGGIFVDKEGNHRVGHMCMSTSPNDPVFFLHHANIDRLWTIWMKKHGKNYAPATSMHGNGLNDKMEPFASVGRSVSPANMLDSKLLGYQYDAE
jgi:tyrosinase